MRPTVDARRLALTAVVCSSLLAAKSARAETAAPSTGKAEAPAEPAKPDKPQRAVKADKPAPPDAAHKAKPKREQPEVPPLLGMEVRIAGGIAFGGGGGYTGIKAAPITVSLLAELAILHDPWIGLYGTAYAETYGRAAFGLGAGLRLHPTRKSLRLSLGFQGTVAPYTTGGVIAGIGLCYKVPHFGRFCGDVEGVALFLGNDIPEGQVVTQLQFALSVGFDAL